MGINKKNIKIVGITMIILVIIVAILIIIFNEKESSLTPSSVAPSEESESIDISVDNPIRNIVGRISYVNVDTIGVITKSGETLTLNVPQSKATFVKQTQQDNKIISKEIGLFNIPKNQDVDIQYNSESSEVMLIVVK